MVVMITSEEYKELVIKANKYDESQKINMCAVENKTKETEKVESKGKHCKNAEMKIEVEKIEGNKAKEIMNFIKKITGEEN